MAIDKAMESQNRGKNKKEGSRSQGQPFFLTQDVSVCKEVILRDRFKVLLLRKGWSQSRLADEIGITKQTLGNIINGYWKPTSQIKIKAAKALGVDSLVIFGAEEYWHEWREKIGYPDYKKKDEENE